MFGSGLSLARPKAFLFIESYRRVGKYSDG